MFCAVSYLQMYVWLYSEMQSPSAWGSKLWAVLHAVGSRTGRSIPRVRADELRELQWMVQNLESIVPCNECRKHIQEYRRHVLPPDRNPGDYNLWFWNFHEAVNTRLGKVGGVPFPLGEQPRVLDTWREFAAIVKIPTVLLKGFERHLRLWAGFAGI